MAKVRKQKTKAKRKPKVKNIKVDDLFCEMVNWAVRYAIGRRTYAVSDTCEFVEKNLRVLNNHTIAVIISDILREEKVACVTFQTLGDPGIDAPYWISLKNLCIQELKRRNTKDSLEWLEWAQYSQY